MKIMNLVSGSSGNSTLIGTEQVTVLCDVGVSMKKIEECLNSGGYTGRDIDAVLITHEHIDHIRGLGVLTRKYGIPVYATEGTIRAALRNPSLGKIDPSLIRIFAAGDSFPVGDLMIRSHRVFHDAADPVCYSFTDGEKKACIVTDLGRTTEDLILGLQGCDYMLVEANHDIRMLEAGSYPYPLKQRILGDHGHLSNEAGGALIRELLNDHVKEIRLGHLSKENNFPELAMMTVRQELLGNPWSPDPEDLPIFIADRDNPDRIVEI
ncbi:MAG: MBL fold metallo-hydrolase [Eubacterium sp.]|nr:MBL fold metallo-hydrolase [Eubacterium sp.]